MRENWEMGTKLGIHLSECVELAGAPLTCTGSGEGGSDGVRWEHVLAFGFRNPREISALGSV